MKKLVSVALVVLLGLGLVNVPTLLGAGPIAFQPFGLAPTSDNGFDLGIAGPKEQAFRWRSLWLASAAIIGATSVVTADAKEMVFARKADGLVSAPGAGMFKLVVVPGTGGACNLVAYAGTSTTQTVVATNVGSGC